MSVVPLQEEQQGTMPVLESKIEQEFVDLCRAHSIVTLKLNLQGNRGWPDRVVLLPKRNVLFIEFKRDSEEPRPLQKYRHQLLESLGFYGLVTNDAKYAFNWVLKKMKEFDQNG